MKLPKLYSWIHHIILSIRLYGAINGFISETYESLHKNYVKQPYRMSNKKNIEMQLMQIVSKYNLLNNQSTSKNSKVIYKFYFINSLYKYENKL